MIFAEGRSMERPYKEAKRLLMAVPWNGLTKRPGIC